MKKIVKNIVIVVLVFLIIYVGIELVRGINGKNPLIVLKKEILKTEIQESYKEWKVGQIVISEKRYIVTEKEIGIIFTSEKSYSTGLSTGWVEYENLLFGFIKIWNETAF